MRGFSGIGWGLLVLVLWAACAGGDCVLLAPEEWRGDLSEQIQLVVVEVQPEGTVRVDLFVSLRDKSGEAREVHLLLPLQAVPEQLDVRTMPARRFQRQRLAEFDHLFYEAIVERLRHRAALESAMSAGSFAAGPVAVAISLPRSLFHRRRRIGYGGLAVASLPTEASVRVERAQVEVYEVLEMDALEASLPEVTHLSAMTREALSSYAGKPFALVKLRTLPRRQRAARRPQRRAPGIALTFTQKMGERDGARCYDYPLGTGRAWERPIPLTQVYVTAPEELDLEVMLPRRPRTANLADYEGNMAYLDESAAWAAEGRQVHMARYDRGNPAEDIRIRLKAQDGGEFVVARQARERRWKAARVGFPLLGALLWTAAFGALVRRDRHAVSLGFWRGLGKSWLVASVLLLGPILLVYTTRRGLSGTSLFELLAMGELTSRHIFLMVFVLVSLVLIAAGMFVLHRAQRSHLGSFLARCLAAAGVAGPAYWLAGRSLVEWLAR